MAKILILSSSYLHKDPRVLRQIKALKGMHHITTCGIAVSGIEGVKEHALLFRPNKKQSFLVRASNYLKMKMRNYEQLTWNKSVYNTLANEDYDVIIVNDPREMPLAVELQKNSKAKIYFDLHEYYIHVDSNPLFNRIYTTLLDKYYQKADIKSTVNQEIADHYINKFGGECRVIKNAGPFKDLQVKKVDDKAIKLVHHGVLNRDRKLERMVEMANALDDRYTMDFYLVGSDLKYLEQLKRSVKDAKKIRFKAQVPFDQLVDKLNEYDIGIFILDPKVKSYELALPNKIFEFIQARLAIAISPNISMKNLVNKWDNGVVADDYSGENLAQKIKDLSIEDIEGMKENSAEAAKVENEEEGVKEVIRIVGEILKSN